MIGMRLSATTVSVVMALASGAPAQEPPADARILDCNDFSKRTDEAALVKRFGRENVVAAKLDGAEGETIRGTVIFPKDPARRLEIYWFDEAKRRGLSSIAVKDKSGQLVRTPGKARTTLGLGATLDQIEEANERPFQINGFGWAYGGYAAGWKGGKLEHMAGSCFFTARFDPDPKATGKALVRVSGDKELGSSDPAVRAVTPLLSKMTLDWAE